MTLSKIHGLPFYAECAGCKTIYPFGDATLSTTAIGGYVEVDGDSARSYYCNLCAEPYERAPNSGKAAT